MEIEPRHIKKYPNRRLYDTGESRYVTLGEIRRLVLAQVDLMVVDRNTETDITRSILLQVVAEQEVGSDPVMSNEFLAAIIRSYGTPRQGAIAHALDQCVRHFR